MENNTVCRVEITPDKGVMVCIQKEISKLRRL